jgi:hypothetical protein
VLLLETAEQRVTRAVEGWATTIFLIAGLSGLQLFVSACWENIFGVLPTKFGNEHCSS